MRDGKIENKDGRVLGTNIYTVGWAKRGPSGVIGTNKSDASDVVSLLIEDLGEPKHGGDIPYVAQRLAFQSPLHEVGLSPRFLCK